MAEWRGENGARATGRRDINRPSFLRFAARRLRYLAGLAAAGFALGIGYRHHFDPSTERGLLSYVLSGVHGVGIAVAAWAVQAEFALRARSRVGAALRRLPLAAEVAVRALVMAAVLTVTAVALQAVLYAEPLRLAWLTPEWFLSTLPRIVGLSLVVSLVASIVTEATRLIGRPLLASVVLGTYQRPVREQRIVGGKHLRITLARDGASHAAILFNQDTPLPVAIRAAYRPEINDWNGTTTLQLVVVHWEAA